MSGWRTGYSPMMNGHPTRPLWATALAVLLALSCIGANAQPVAPGKPPAQSRFHGKVTIYRDAKGVPHIF
jgi:acyl-homoserine lactone acylase PvdQ